MSKKIKLAAICIAAIATTIYAADSGIGTSDDPLVTKSYVDQKVAEMNKLGNNNIDEELEAQQLLIETLLADIEKLKAEKNSSYEVVTVKEGQTIQGKSGSEIIVRGGEAIAVGSEAGGLQNMTEGVDIEDGGVVPKYHLMIIPREDGRGLYAKTTLTVMVRGGYTLQ